MCGLDIEGNGSYCADCEPIEWGPAQLVQVVRVYCGHVKRNHARECVLIALRVGYNTGMTGINSQKQMIAPRQTPGTLFSDRGRPPLGGHIKNATKNHPTIAQSITSSAETANEFNVEQAPAAQIQPAPKNHSDVLTVETVQPGQYHPGYCEQMIEYFDRPKMKEIIDSYTWKSGAVSEKSRFVPNTPPHFSEFARSIGVTTRTLNKWARENPEFRNAHQICQEILEEFLIDNGLVGAYGAIAMKFVAVNRSKMKDKQVHENQAIDLNQVLDAIADGKVRPGGQMELPGEEEY